MDEVELSVERVKSEWEEVLRKAESHVVAIETYGAELDSLDSGGVSLPRLNSMAEDSLTELELRIFQLDLLVPQLPSEILVNSASATLDSWKAQVSNIKLGLRNANAKAKENVRKAAKRQRELLLGGGEDSTLRRRNLQTKAEMTAAAEGITDSLRRSQQIMVQEVERSTNTLMTMDESTGVLKKAESEYKGHRSLLARTRNLLSSMERQETIQRVMIVVGFLCFSAAVIYVVSKRIGLFKLQRKVAASWKATRGNELNAQNVVPAVVEQLMHDEL